MRQQLVRDLLKEKGLSAHGTVHCLAADASVGSAAKELTLLGIGALLVGTTDAWLGLCSERDIVHHLAHGGTRDDPVSACMTEKLVTVTPEDSLSHCSTVMTDRRIRHLPVVDNKRLIGLVSIGDVMRATVSEKDFALEQLGRYLTDSFPVTG